MRRAVGLLEHGDRPLPVGELAPYLDDLDRLNAGFGGYALVRRTIARVIRRARVSHRETTQRALVIADVGGSRGDFAVRLARTRGLGPITVIVVDRDETSLVMGQRAAKDSPGVRWVQADARALPFRAATIDVVTTSLTLHHLEPEAAVAALAGMREAARLGVVVNDLLRTRLHLASVWLITRLLARHRFARDDGPRSVRRAYSARELRTLATRAGFRSIAIRRHPVLGRLVAVLS